MFKKFIVWVFGIKGKHLHPSELSVTEVEIKYLRPEPILIQSEFSIDKYIFDKADLGAIQKDIKFKLCTELFKRMDSKNLIRYVETTDFLLHKQKFHAMIKILDPNDKQNPF